MFYSNLRCSGLVVGLVNMRLSVQTPPLVQNYFHSEKKIFIGNFHTQFRYFVIDPLTKIQQLNLELFYVLCG